MAKTSKRSRRLKCFHLEEKGATEAQRLYQLLCAPGVWIVCASWSQESYQQVPRSHGGRWDHDLRGLSGQVKFTLPCFAGRNHGKFEIEDDHRNMMVSEVYVLSRVQDRFEERNRLRTIGSRPCGEQWELRPGWGEWEGKRILCIYTCSEQSRNRII